MLERLKGLWSTHRKLCYLGIAFVISVASYVVLGQEVEPQVIVDKGCELVGGC
jgi:hypothetical protein